MTKISNIAKNTSYLTLALILQKIISFTYFTLLARYLGPADLGKYYFAISFTTIFAIFIDLGFANVLTREVAKDQTKAEKWLGNVLTLKIPLALIALAAVFILINVLKYDPLTKSLVYISAISMVLDSFTTTFFAVVRGFHNLKYESISSIIFQIIVLTVGYSALLLGGGLIPAMAALALASLYNFIYSGVIIKNRLKMTVRFIYDQPLVKEIVKISWPFAVYAIFQRLYTYLDSVLLSVLAGDEQVGLYQVAFKIIFALQFLPMAFTASLYPALSAYWQTNRAQLVVSFERAMNYLIIISLPIIVGAVVLADKVVLLFKTGYGGAVVPLQISIASLFFIFINFPIGSLLNACDRQGRNTFNMGLVTILSIGLNFLLIPHWQAVGASLTVLITNILMTVLGIYWVKKIIPYQARKNLKILARVIGASLLMGIIIFVGKQYLNIFLITILGALIYFSCLFFLGGFKKEDFISIYQSFRG
ncbi:MAG: flippase [Patescibacteria group bacterium]|jgi:O-antigen/teichoic acid export membrane protein